MSRFPSVKTLSQVFDNPEEARKVFQMTREELENTAGGMRRVRECLNPPCDDDLIMNALNDLQGGLYGVEGVKAERSDEYAEFLNTGDMYAATVILWRGKYRVQSLGDFVEKVCEFQPYSAGLAYKRARGY